MIIQILKHTPIWVYVLFFLLLYIGINNLKSREIRVQTLFIAPLLILLLSIAGVASSFNVSFASVSSWTAGFLLGLGLMRLIFKPEGVKFLLTHRKILVPGSWLPLVMMMAIFFVKYAVGVILARNPEEAFDLAFIIPVCLAYGVFSGSFLGRTLWLYLLVQTGRVEV